MNHHIPKQQVGKKIDAAHDVTFHNIQDARDFYYIVRNRLLAINHWSRIAKLPMSTFQLIGPTGESDIPMARVGDYIKIDIPGPGPSNDQHVDYVRIEEIEETDTPEIQLLTLRLRPSEEPGANSTAEVQHFFSQVSTSNFQIQRDGKTITASYFGRNEVINTDVDTLSDQLRNRVVGWAAKLGFSYPQWDALVKGLVDDAITKNSDT